MSKERELIKDMKILLECTDMGGLQRNADVLIGRAIELLAQPEQEGVYQKLLRIEDGIEIEILPSEVWLDGYEAGKRSALLSKKPEQEPVAWMWTRNYEGGGYTNKVFEFLNDAEEYAKDSKTLKSPDIIRPLYTAPPKRELLGDGITADMYRANKKATHPDSYWAGVYDAEKAHGIGGGE